MKKLFLTLFLLTYTLLATVTATSTYKNVDKLTSVLTKVVSLLDVQNKQHIALVRYGNVTEPQTQQIKRLLENNRFTVTVYNYGQFTEIKEDVVMVQSLGMIKTIPQLLDKKIVISENLEDVKNGKAGISIQEINGNSRVFINNNYFQEKNMKLDARLVRAATLVQK
jgi:hypothetical protein